METKATLKFVRISPQKARLVADMVRNLPVGQAIDTLDYTTKKSAQVIKKILMSAIANAEHNFAADIDELKVSQIYVDKGPVLKRLRPRAKGRANRILKPTAHITIAVSDNVVGESA